MTAPTTEHRLRPRKTPTQRRAHETRARILDAARAVFATDGYAAGTTNRIAAKADLSVGSLYQYFPNKDAILIELVRDHVADGAERLATALATAEAEALDLDTTIHHVVAALVEVHAGDPRLHQVLFEESPRPPSLLQELHTLEDLVVAGMADRLRVERPHLADPVLSARITVTTIESLVHRLVASDRPIDLDAFVTEVCDLISGYLAPH
jgi:AcrR family transcriptional regulator